jgi:hypothetical protein
MFGARLPVRDPEPIRRDSAILGVRWALGTGVFTEHPWCCQCAGGRLGIGGGVERSAGLSHGERCWARWDDYGFLKPCPSFLSQVYISNMHGSQGVIDDAIFFTLDSLKLPPGYVPQLHDLVDVVIVESAQSCYTWRAVSMTPVQMSQ